MPKNMLCNHDAESPSTSLRPIIKVPKASLTPERIREEMMKPDAMCVSCGRMFRISFDDVVCVRKSK